MELVNLTSNYFELFGLPAAFDLGQEKLSEQYRLLQKVVHPDKFANASDYEKRISVQQSARINEAYQTLKQPLSRAQYLLKYLSKVNGTDLDNEDAHMDPDFLMQQMDLREKIDGARSNPDSGGELIRIANDIRQMSKNIVKKISELFAGNTQNNLQEIRELVRRLQFLSRIQDEILEIEATIL